MYECFALSFPILVRWLIDILSLLYKNFPLSILFLSQLPIGPTTIEAQTTAGVEQR